MLVHPVVLSLIKDNIVFLHSVKTKEVPEFTGSLLPGCSVLIVLPHAMRNSFDILLILSKVDRITVEVSIRGIQVVFGIEVCRLSRYDRVNLVRVCFRLKYNHQYIQNDKL